MAWDYYRDLTTSIGDYHATLPDSIWTAIKAKLDAGTYNASGYVQGVSLYNITVCNNPFQLVEVNQQVECAIGNGRLYLDCYIYYAGSNRCSYRLSSDTLIGGVGGGNQHNAISVIFAYNDDTHQACMIRLLTSYYTSPVNEVGYALYSASQSERELLYNDLLSAIHVLYNWQSVPSISGKNGILSCTYIEQEAIGDATDGWINREYITEGTHCDDLFAGMNQGTVYNFMETVDGYRLVVRRYDDHYTIGLKVGDDVDWADNITVANLGITSIGFVIDPENQVGKFFKCYLSSEAGVPKYAVLYSPVMSLPNIDTLLEHVYTYVQGGQSGEGPDEIDPDDGGSQQQGMPDTAISGVTTPTKSALETGFVTMYEMSSQQLTALAIYMWTTDFIEWLKKLYNDPKDVIVGLSIMPYPPLKSDTPTHVYAGNVTTSVNGYPLTNQYRTITFGTLKLKKEFYDFCDYSPFTKASISIPYCGSHELNMSDVIGCKLTLKYIFDYLTGTCVAEIDVKKDGVDHPRYFFTGNCAFKIPISSGDYGCI
jgi:hypothetical protein